MKRPLDDKTRGRWDALIKTEGAALGLSRCRPFLENKLVNDIFYEGVFHSIPCIVKCSSRAPDSILNEAAMGERLYAADPDVFPRVLAHFKTADGEYAFVVTKKISGPPFAVLCACPDRMRPQVADGFAADLLRIATALRQTGIVHRDINPYNLLFDEDGHLKLIDFQFAIDRNDYHESSFMRKNWKYLYIVFAFSNPLGGAAWNDTRAIRLRAQMMPPTDRVKEAIAALEAEEAVSLFTITVPRSVRWRLRGYCASLFVQRLFCREPEKINVIKQRMSRAKALLKMKD